MPSVHPEALLLSAVAQTGEYQALAANGISLDFFHAYPDEADWLMRYVQKNWRAPSKAAIRQHFPEFTIYKVEDTGHWCEEVRSNHKRQSIVDMMDAAMDLVDAEDEDAAEALIRRGLSKMQTSTAGVHSGFSAFDQWEEVYETIKAKVERAADTGYAGIPTGFKTLDDITGGAQPGWFGVIAARLGEGKTWTGVQMAWAASSHGYKVSYFSLEQSRLQIAMRMHAFASRQFAREVFNPMDLNRGRGFDLMAYKRFMADLKEKRGSGDFRINDTARGRVSPATIAAVIEVEQPDLVIIDYLTLLSADTDDWKGTAKLSGDIQGAAQRYSTSRSGRCPR